MSQGYVIRPKAQKGKIHSKDEFELCYLRHQYVRKVNFNPTKEDMAPYMWTIKHCAKNTFFTYRNLFHMIGFESEDLINIGMVHLVSYLGLFSLEKMPEKYDDFVLAFWNKHSKDPKEYDSLSKNKANFTIFLKQRMEDVVRVCRQKARNVKGLPTDEHFIFWGPHEPPAFLRDLIENYEKYGFRKLDVAIYKSIKKKIKPDAGPVFKFNGNWYIAVPVDQKSLSLSDFSGADQDPYDNIHNMTPEQIYFNKQDTKKWSKIQSKFDSKSRRYRARVVREFIDKNQNNPKFAEEIKTAKTLLRDLGV